MLLKKIDISDKDLHSNTFIKTFYARAPFKFQPQKFYLVISFVMSINKSQVNF